MGFVLFFNEAAPWSDLARMHVPGRAGWLAALFSFLKNRQDRKAHDFDNKYTAKINISLNGIKRKKGQKL